MHMYNERMQILISKEQRRRLEQEAERRDASVASVIREAVDAHLGGVGREDRIAAAEAIAAMEPGPYISPEDLERMIAEAYDEQTRFPPEGAPE
jgi:predicted DNA-binding protein